jgi:hypothetical protein
VSLTINGQPRILKAHKVAYEMKHDRKIGSDIRVSHTCGERLCCNPNHLDFTPIEPAASAPERIEPTNQKARGQTHGAAKLTDKQVGVIKYKLTALSTREIADLFEVQYHAIWDIRHGLTWRHI